MGEIIKIEPTGRPVRSAIEDLEHFLRARGIPESIRKELRDYEAELQNLWQWPSESISVNMPENFTEAQRAQIAAAIRVAFTAYNTEIYGAKVDFVMALVKKRFFELFKTNP